MASLTVTSPSTGATWDSGEAHSITWTKTPLSGTWGAVTIYLYKNNVYQEAIATNLSSSSSSYSWSIESAFTAGSDYTITINTSHTEGGGGEP